MVMTYEVTLSVTNKMAPTIRFHARVFEGVAKSHFLLKAVVFKSQKPRF